MSRDLFVVLRSVRTFTTEQVGSYFTLSKIHPLSQERSEIVVKEPEFDLKESLFFWDRLAYLEEAGWECKYHYECGNKGFDAIVDAKATLQIRIKWTRFVRESEQDSITENIWGVNSVRWKTYHEGLGSFMASYLCETEACSVPEEGAANILFTVPTNLCEFSVSVAEQVVCSVVAVSRVTRYFGETESEVTEEDSKSIEEVLDFIHHGHPNQRG